MKNKITHNKKKSTVGKYLLVSALVIIADQITKWYYGAKVKNTGIIFGLFQDSNTIMIFVSIIVAAIILVAITQSKVKNKILYAFILGGVFGNLIDRLIKGYVVDWAELWIIPTFNIADAAISCSVFLLIFLSLYEDYNKKRKLKNFKQK